MTDPSHEPLADRHLQTAIGYLRNELGDDAPATLRHEATFLGAPLDDEGDMSVFAFEASVGGEPAAQYNVVAGETVPNYYPRWNLDAAQSYELHLGTRFMLVLQVAQVASDEIPADAVDRTVAFIGTVAPGEDVSDVQPAAAFRVEDDVYAVFRAKIGEEEVYVLGAACPPGIYREIDLPPHVIFRRHLGAMIRREADKESP